MRHQVLPWGPEPRSRDTESRQIRSAVSSVAAARLRTPPPSLMITHSVVSGSKVTHTDRPTWVRPTQWHRSYTDTLPLTSTRRATADSESQFRTRARHPC